jgi:hypothetical protein
MRFAMPQEMPLGLPPFEIGHEIIKVKNRL